MATTGIPIPYVFQSVSTKFFVVSNKEDKAGQKVNIKRSISGDDSVRAQLSTLASHLFIHFWSGFIH